MPVILQYCIVCGREISSPAGRRRVGEPEGRTHIREETLLFASLHPLLFGSIYFTYLWILNLRWPRAALSTPSNFSVSFNIFVPLVRWICKENEK